MAELEPQSLSALSMLTQNRYADSEKQQIIVYALLAVCFNHLELFLNFCLLISFTVLSKPLMPDPTPAQLNQNSCHVGPGLMYFKAAFPLLFLSFLLSSLPLIFTVLIWEERHKTLRSKNLQFSTIATELVKQRNAKSENAINLFLHLYQPLSSKP